MPKFSKIVKTMMSGDMNSAADEFVDRLFNRVIGKDKALNEIIREATTGLSREQIRAISSIGNDDLMMLDDAFDNHSNMNGDLDFDALLPLLKARVGVAFQADEGLLHDVWATIQDELEVREDEIHDMGDQYDARDYDAEDEAAAFNDRYQQFRNEY